MLLSVAEDRLVGQRGAQGSRGAGGAWLLYGWLFVRNGGDH
jgi:hypothetical protein